MSERATQDRAIQVAARALSILASDPRWTLDEVCSALVGEHHWQQPRAIAFRAMAQAAMKPALNHRECRAEAEAMLRTRRRR